MHTLNNLMNVDHRVGDKVAIKTEGEVARSVIEERVPVAACRTRQGLLLYVASAALTNDSAIARKAWSKYRT